MSIDQTTNKEASPAERIGGGCALSVVGGVITYASYAWMDFLSRTETVFEACCYPGANLSPACVKELGERTCAFLAPKIPYMPAYEGMMVTFGLVGICMAGIGVYTIVSGACASRKCCCIRTSQESRAPI